MVLEKELSKRKNMHKILFRAETPAEKNLSNVSSV